MIATDGTATIANAPSVARVPGIKRARMLRAWYSAVSAYGDSAPFDFLIREAAQDAGVTISVAIRVMHDAGEGDQYDPDTRNVSDRWNLH